MLPDTWCCFVINLRGSPERLRAMSCQLAAEHIDFMRYEAVDGGVIDPDRTPHFDRRRYEARHGKRPSGREIGCFLSHVGVLEAFLASGKDHCLVLEDDAILEPGFSSVLAEIAATNHLWDTVLLYGNHRGAPFTQRHLNGTHRLVGFFLRQTGAVAYVINRKAARAYVKLLPMSLPYDLEFDRAWDLGIRFRGVLPFPVSTGRHPSDIGVTGHKFAWYRRWQTYGARARNEMRRLLHYGTTDPIWLKAAGGVLVRMHRRVAASLCSRRLVAQQARGVPLDV